MPPLSDQREILENLNLLAVRDVNDLWRGASAMDLSTDEFRETIVTATPEVLTPYASTAADLSAQWYDDAAPELPYRAAPAAIAATEQMAASTSWALYATGQLALGRLAGLAQRTIFNANRATIVDNAKRETGATWARHASATACAFCRMLATRGAVYSSKGASVSAEGRGRYHDHCHCMAVMVRPGATYEPPAYVEEWEKEYRDAVRATPKLGDHGALDTKAVLAHMRAGETVSKAPPSPKVAAGGAKPPIKPPVSGKIIPGGEDGEPLPKRLTRAEAETPHIDITARDRRHILDGEPDNIKAGGHRSGVGRPGKTEFPPDWDDDRIIAAVRATVDEHHWTMQRGDATLRRLEIDGVIVEVASYPKDGAEIMRHAYPVNGAGVVKNDRATGEVRALELDRSVLYELPPRPRKR
ncbi:EndoU domain-containing protein [Rhodococcus erythropolis]|uniref:Uncharacterized protein n=1 Tax=Rhodococcus erythropolis (strain PR4 / NBRC 100887) TaxID=234621 RepID=C0ZX96_RHOE4|nr:EndoU domain-containing protein [Rhodococcus erythropolis]BAH32981.1 hypothetical protein RER_22730 [Rhodococcus erythropolis PR4]